MKKYTLLKIKPGKYKEWEKWCRELNQRKKEGAETLLEENLLRKRCILFNEGKDAFVVYEHEIMPWKKEKPMNMLKAINKKHHEMLQSLVFIKEGEGMEGKLGYDFAIESRQKFK